MKKIKPFIAWVLAFKSRRKFEIYPTTMSSTKRDAEKHIDRGFINVEAVKVEVRPVRKGKK